MKRLRIYVDTSVIGGCFDPEFRAWSNGLIKDFRARRFHLVLSDAEGKWGQIFILDIAG